MTCRACLYQCVLFRGYWKSFIDGLQRVIIFTPDEGVLERIRAENSYSVPLFEASLSFRSIGLSLVDNDKRRELAYIAITQWVWARKHIHVIVIIKLNQSKSLSIRTCILKRPSVIHCFCMSSSVSFSPINYNNHTLTLLLQVRVHMADRQGQGTVENCQHFSHWNTRTGISSKRDGH